MAFAIRREETSEQDAAWLFLSRKEGSQTYHWREDREEATQMTKEQAEDRLAILQRIPDLEPGTFLAVDLDDYETDDDAE